MNRFLRDDRGFTLLELLVAMSLLAVIVVVVVGAMRLGFRAIETGDRKIVALERVRTSLSVIEAQLQSAFSIAPPREAQAGEAPVQFKGETGSVEFRSFLSLWGGTKGPVAVTYRIVDDGRGRKALVISETPLGMDAVRETVLIDLADEIIFEFFYRGPTDEKGYWVELWEQTDRLPSKVRLTVRKDNRLMTVVAPLRLAPKETQTAASGSRPVVP